MISKIPHFLKRGLQYIQLHPQFLLIITLVVVLPLLILYVGNSFLSASDFNRDRILKDRIGIIHDTLEAQIRTEAINVAAIQSVIDKIAERNNDILKLRVLVIKGEEIVTLAALNPDLIGNSVSDAETTLYDQAFVGDGNGVILPFIGEDGVEHWQSLRGIRHNHGDVYYILTETTLAQYEAAFAYNQNKAYSTLFFVFLFLAALAFWVYRLTDYRYLYLALQKRSEEKDTFLNLMAHELRAPLTAMRGYASLILESTDVPDVQKEHARRIEQSTQRLVQIINDVLEVARIQSGKLSIEFADVHVGKVINTVVDELRPQAEKKGLELHQLSIPEDLTVYSDSKRLHQVLTNILSNSIKYTKTGSVGIEVIDKSNIAEIRIKDTGVGIHAEDQKKLFAPFFRVQNDSTEKVTGTGLGMWITKQLTEMFGGSIGIESMSGVGTTVVVSIPTHKPKD